jgi:hypothetical protein
MAEFLDKHPAIVKVHYPSLPHHRDHAVAMRKSMFAKGFGGVLSFEIKGDGNPWSQETFDATARFIDALEIPYIGPSLGGVETLIEQVRVIGYYDQPLEVRQRLSITNGLVRYACGIEDAADLIADVAQVVDMSLSVCVRLCRAGPPASLACLVAGSLVLGGAWSLAAWYCCEAVTDSSPDCDAILVSRAGA